MVTKRLTPSTSIVAGLCLYGTTDSRIGAGYLGYLGAELTDRRQLFGTGDPTPGRTFTECIYMAAGELAARGIVRGIVRVFDSGGLRMADLDLSRLPIYGAIGDAWRPATVYTLSIADLTAASEVQS